MNDYNQNEEKQTMGEEDLNLEEHQTRVPFSQILKDFFTGRLFKCILLAFGVHIVFIMVTSIGMFFAEEKSKNDDPNADKEQAASKDDESKGKDTGKDAEKDVKKSDAADNGKDGEEEGSRKSGDDETDKDTGDGENDDAEKEDADKNVDQTKPTGNPDDYTKKHLETITPDKAPDNPLETKDDEDELP